MENLAAADSAINTWNNKYHFSLWRPFQAIRRAAADGNSATSPDLTWTPLISAPYPEYTSGHLGLDGAHATVLQRFFGDAPAGGYQITSAFVNPGGPPTRTFSSFSQAVDEIVEARKDTTVVIHPLTDHRRALPLDKKGELVRAHPDFQLVISYNPGYQSLMKDLKTSTRQRFAALFGTADKTEGIGARLDKRPARFD